MSSYLQTGLYTLFGGGGAAAWVAIEAGGTHTQWWSKGPRLKRSGTGRVGVLRWTDGGDRRAHVLEPQNGVPDRYEVAQGREVAPGSTLPGELDTDQRQIDPGSMTLEQSGQVVGALLVANIAGRKLDRWVFFSNARPIREAELTIMRVVDGPSSGRESMWEHHLRVVNKHDVHEVLDLWVDDRSRASMDARLG